MPEEKTNCTSCNAKILRYTAELNGGLCEPCAKKVGCGREYRYWRNLVEEAEADPTKAPSLDKSPFGILHWTIENDQEELFSRALLAGAKIECETKYSNSTPLHYAAQQSNPYFLNLLIKNGCSLDRGDREKRTALHYAAESGMVYHARRLIEAGCNPKPYDRHKKTPLDLAFSKGHFDVIKFISGIPNAKNRSWSIRLFSAVQGRHPEILEWLLSKGANPATKNRNGESPLDVARVYPLDWELGELNEEQIERVYAAKNQIIQIIETALKANRQRQ